MSPSPSLANNGNSVRNSVDANTINTFESGMQGITDLPDDYLGQSSLLKQLAKEVKVPPTQIPKPESLDILQLQMGTLDLNNLPAPPEYPKWSQKSPIHAAVNKTNKLNEKAALSKSQPDLSVINENSGVAEFRRGTSAPRPPTKGREDHEGSGEQICPSAEMVDLLSKENSALKLELNKYWQRIAKTEKVSEILKIIISF